MVMAIYQPTIDAMKANTRRDFFLERDGWRKNYNDVYKY